MMSKLNLVWLPTLVVVVLSAVAGCGSDPTPHIGDFAGKWGTDEGPLYEIVQSSDGETPTVQSLGSNEHWQMVIDSVQMEGETLAFIERAYFLDWGDTPDKQPPYRHVFSGIPMTVTLEPDGEDRLRMTMIADVGDPDGDVVQTELLVRQ